MGKNFELPQEGYWTFPRRTSANMAKVSTITPGTKFDIVGLA